MWRTDTWLQPYLPLWHPKEGYGLSSKESASIRLVAFHRFWEGQPVPWLMEFQPLPKLCESCRLEWRGAGYGLDQESMGSMGIFFRYLDTTWTKLF